MKLLLFVVLGSVTTFTNDTDLLQAFRDRHLQFTANLYKQLLKINTGNLLMCPISIDVILATVLAGVKGNTADQLIKGLQLSNSSEVIQQTLRALLPALHGNTYYNFRSANKIFVQDGYKIKDTYKTTANEVFETDIENINFKQPEKAVKTVNSWVKEKTYDLIDDVINQDDLDNNTNMLLISTVYFEDAMNTFNSFHTTNFDFYLNKNLVIKIDVMQSLDYFQYYESTELKAKFLKLVYNFDPDQVTTVIVLPNDKEGLADLETKIDEVLVQSSFTREYVSALIPKFKLETTINFKSILQNLGIVDAFKDDADFDGIDTNHSLKISNIFQKVIIDLNEDGTNAEYISPKKFSYRHGGHSAVHRFSPPKQFHADHPFLFYIKINGVFAFVGRLNWFPTVNVVIPKSNKFEKSSSKKKPKRTSKEERITSIVDEYTCPCNLI